MTAAICCAAWLSAAARASSPDGPPAYNLNVGDWLVFERRAMVAALDTGAVHEQVRDQIQVWVIASNGHWRRLLAELVRTVDNQPIEIHAAVFDMDPFGRKRLTPETAMRIADMDGVFDMFPELPSEEAPDAEWLSSPDAFGRQWRSQLRGPDAAKANAMRYSFSVEDSTHVGDFLGESRRGRFWFNTNEGIVSRVESEWRHGAAGKLVQAKAKLRLRTHTEPEWCTRRAAEAQRFLTAMGDEERLLRVVIDNPAAIDSTVKRMKNLWASFASNADARERSPFVDIGRAYERRVQKAEWHLREIALHRGYRQNRPMTDWILPGPDGRESSSREIRTQRVLVEVYWSATSLWGLRALELARQIRSSVSHREVAVVCINVDRDRAAASRAIQVCGHRLVHVFGASIANTEGAYDVPTYRVIGHDGTIRFITLGWNPNIAAVLMPTISAAIHQP
jgi:hypothetical protein